MRYCKICGKKLELTPEYDMCMECQGKQHRTFIFPNNDSIATNHINTEMTPKEALDRIRNRFGEWAKNNMKELQTLEQSLTEQEKKDELLELYRELHETQDMVTYENVLEQINALEEELK